MSLTIDGTAVAGWAEYGDGDFQHFTGQANPDDTLSVGAYNGRTLSISGDRMTATNYKGDQRWYKVSKEDFEAAGGQTSGD